MIWIRRRVSTPRRGRGFYPVVSAIESALPELADVKIGTLNIFLQHTSAALTINENADPDVLIDLGAGLDAVAPESSAYRHDLEGDDDMPAHIKSSLLGPSLTVPVEDGRLLLGIWQTIYLCEFRRAPHERTLILTLAGET
ncbi:MAG: YjbQ family protein [Thermoguttaceae bacterium]|nr:YjbQ family protein [Thermoguttaceae bacterium]